MKYCIAESCTAVDHRYQKGPEPVQPISLQHSGYSGFQSFLKADSKKLSSGHLSTFKDKFVLKSFAEAFFGRNLF